ncbi:MAG: DUF5615 family PIN-like protein [Bauldia sp.]|nr:DUF5615 family PIN-like protein [Bauldia sp.]
MARLLLDQNLSHRLLAGLADRFPGSGHVREVGLSRATDFEVFDHARRNGFILVSKDGDFHHFALLYGSPPKVVWLRVGNCSTDDILTLLLDEADRIAMFAAKDDEALLVLPAD